MLSSIAGMDLMNSSVPGRPGKETKMPATANRIVTSSYTRAYRVLRDACKQKGGPLDISTAQERLEITPGLVFARGASMSKILGKLERWKLIRVNGSTIEILDDPC